MSSAPPWVELSPVAGQSVKLCPVAGQSVKLSPVVSQSEELSPVAGQSVKPSPASCRRGLKSSVKVPALSTTSTSAHK